MRVSRNASVPGVRRRVAAMARAAVLSLMGLVMITSVPVITTYGDETGAAQRSLPSAQGTDREWRFRVFLDDKEIGSHDFYLRHQGVTRLLRSVADFEYKLLFVKLYDYQHENSEIWQGNCLSSVESSTDANGKPFTVLGQLQSDAFIVQGSKGSAALPACVMSFAYWNPEFLKQTRLLNTQNGEYLEVQVSAPVFGELKVQGELRPAWHYHLVAGPLNLELWYSEESEWLGLESETEGGRTLRYELL